MSHVLKFMAAAFVIAAVSLAEAMPLGLRTAMWNGERFELSLVLQAIVGYARRRTTTRSSERSTA